MEKIESSTICLMLILHGIAGVATLTCYEGVDGQRLINVKCPGSCFAKSCSVLFCSAQTFTVGTYRHVYGCNRMTQQVGCHADFFSVVRHCSFDLCNTGVYPCTKPKPSAGPDF